MILFLDTEVRGPKLDPSKGGVGLDNYARHPATRVLLFPYAIDDGPAKLWDCWHQTPPDELLHAMRTADRLVAHNAQFDRVVLQHQFNYRPELSRWYCTEARANIHGLPGALDKLSRIFRLGDDAKKKKRGDELIKLFCAEPFADPDKHPTEWLEFCEYAIYDVIAMRELYKRMPDWCFTELEQRVYTVNQKINERGFAVDLDFAERMIKEDEQAEASLNARTHALTDGFIQRGTQREKIQKWLNDDNAPTWYGLNDELKPDPLLVDMRAETLNKALRDHRAGRVNLTPAQEEMINLRLLTAKSSIAKCRTALITAAPDHRVRYTIKYAGGGRIGRFSHKGFQPGNMPRPTHDKDLVHQACELIEQGMLYTMWGDEARSVCADCVRGIIVAAPGHKLIAADWSNIEGRKLAWYADEKWKLQAYRDKDAGRGHDLYVLLWHKMTGTPIEEIDDFVRQQGKGADLSMGYEGGVGAWLNIANSYKIDMIEVAEKVPTQVSPAFMAAGRADWARAKSQGDTHGLPFEVFVAASALKHSWRAAHPSVVGLWAALIACAKAAVINPGKLFQCAKGKVLMKATPDWLAVEIPSGRKIMFAKPRISVKPILDENGKDTGKTREILSALKAPMWFRSPLYGGLIANAITQGGCRDILSRALLRVDEAGYPIVLHIHDDITAEVPIDGPYTLQGLIDIMEQREPWFNGLPLAATGFETRRLYKG